MAVTIEKLAKMTLSKLGVWQRDELDPEDLENVSDAYACVYERLKDDALVTWATADDIPNRFSLPIATLVAAEIASYYNVSPPAEGWEKTKLLATNTIRRQLATGQDPEPVEAEYF